MKKAILFSACLAALLIAGCQAPSYPTATNNDILTLGTVQKSIYKGMTQGEVLESLGAPNLVTRDKNGLETWAYDKASTTVTLQESSVYGTVLLIGGIAASGQATHTQRTLTLILKFKDNVLSEYTYRSTSF